MSKDLTIRWTLALVVTVASLIVSQHPLMIRTEMGLYDSRAKILARRNAPSEDIVIVAIDEESLQRLNEAQDGKLTFPWPRSVYAYVVEYINAADAIFLDVLLADPDRSTDGKLHDGLFVDVANQMESLILAVSLTLDDSPRLRKESSKLPMDVLTDDEHGDRAPYANTILPFDGLLNSGNRFGHIRYHPDEIDGTLRKYQVLAPLPNGGSLPSAALAAAQAMEGLPKGSRGIDETGRIQLKNGSIKVDKKGQFNLLPTAKVHTAYRVADVIASRQQEAALQDDPNGDPPLIPRDAFAGKAVVFGSLAEGLKDTVITPFDNYTQGMVVHAIALDNMLEGESILLTPPWLAYLLVIVFVLFVALPRNLGSKRTFLLGIGITTLYLLVGYGILLLAPLMIPLAAPLVSTWLGTLIIGGHTWYIDERERRYQEELEKAKQSFTDMLVHDIKNAAAPMSLALEFMRDDDVRENTELFDEFMGTADDAQTNLLNLVGNLLDIRKLEEGRLPVKPQAVDANEFFQGITKMFQGTATRKKKPITLKVTGSRPLYADTNILKRVLENLMWNAIAYGEPGQNIELEVTEQKLGWEISVANDCKRIQPETVTKLFDAYVSGGEQTNMPMRSTGLGLAFCKMAALGHNGHIEALSPRPGAERGIKFILFLPSEADI